METSFRVGMLLFPCLTQLDLTAPFEIFARMPGTEVLLVAETLQPVTSDRGLVLIPSITFDACPPLDLLFIPGGPGQIEAMDNAKLLGFIRMQDRHTRYTTSTCTGSLLLAASGLLRGRRATSHWAVMRALAIMGAVPVSEIVVEDGKYITGAGVINGLELALYIVEKLHGKDAADRIHVHIEYQPEAGRQVSAEGTQAVRGRILQAEPLKSMTQKREAQAERIAQQLKQEVA